jgi:hypothetical protein
MSLLGKKFNAPIGEYSCSGGTVEKSSEKDEAEHKLKTRRNETRMLIDFLCSTPNVAFLYSWYVPEECSNVNARNPVLKPTLGVMELIEEEDEVECTREKGHSEQQC